MMVLVDTPVWSLALRRQRDHLNPNEAAVAGRLADLIRDGRARLMGPIRQELLSGLRGEEPFRRLRDYLRAFDEPNLQMADYEEAAAMNNRCRTHGIAGSTTDFLICAVAHRRNWEILTTDRDFLHFQKALPIRLAG